MGKALNSAIYACEVVHCRLKPRRHEFRYRLFFLDLDLEELPCLSKERVAFSHNRFNLFSFYDRDHVDLGCQDARENLATWLSERGLTLPDDARLRLITLPRVLGYIFNPVCFYFITTKDGLPLHAVVEVRNTFKELKLWLIEHPESADSFHLTAPKEFYVSPFSSLTAKFDFRLRVPGDAIEIHIDTVEEDEPIVVSWIRGERRALTDARLLWYALCYPLMTLQVIVKIHWQAFRLWMRDFPYHRKAERSDQQRDMILPPTRDHEPHA